MNESLSPPTLAAVRAARSRIASELKATGLIPHLDGEGREVLLKPENLQRTGSFKLRGALNAVLTLSAAEADRGVVTASAGNHGLGVATAARVRGVGSTVFVPRDAPRTKIDRIARQGGALRLVPGGYDEADAEASEYARLNGQVYIHAFSDPAVVAGQGTVGLEILEEVPEPGAVVVPVGGGGLIGGIGVVMRALSPGTRLIGVQTPPTSAMARSLAAGRPVAPPAAATLCDGLAGEIDARSLRLAQQVVDEMVLVEEAAVRSAIACLHRAHDLTVEGSGAVGMAALLSDALPEVRGPVVILLTGGNIDPSLLYEILEEPADAACQTRFGSGPIREVA